MERWEEEVVEGLRRPVARLTPTAAAPRGSTDPLALAFDDLSSRLGRSVARIAEAVPVDVQVDSDADGGRTTWRLGARTLRLRRDDDAKKVFVSCEADAGLELAGLWFDDGMLRCDNGVAGRPADPDDIVRRFVTLFFRG